MKKIILITFFVGLVTINYSQSLTITVGETNTLRVSTFWKKEISPVTVQAGAVFTLAAIDNLTELKSPIEGTKV
jgi:hypothetical protein